jgi:hypothetical protein
MSFMKGFAEGFATTFNAMEQRRAAHKQDAVRMAYDSWLKKQTDYREAETKDKALIDAAKTAVVQAGKGVPASAWPHAYQLLKADMPMTEVIKQLRGSTWSAQLVPEAPEAPEPQQVGMEGEMVNAGLTPPTPEDIAPPNFNPASMNVTDTQNYGAPPQDLSVPPMGQETQQQSPFDPMKAMFGEEGMFNPDANRRRQAERAQQEVMRTTGVSQEEWDQIMAGYQSPVPDMVEQFDPAERVVPVSYDENVAEGKPNSGIEPKDLVPLFNAIDERLKVLPDRYSKVKGFLRQAKEVDDMVRQMPETLRSVTGGVVVFNEIKGELETAVSIAQQIFNRDPDGNAKPSELMETLERELSKENVLEELGANRQLVMSKILRMIYAAGEAAGQSGQAFANRDFEAFKETIMASKDYTTFSRGIREFATERVAELEDYLTYLREKDSGIGYLRQNSEQHNVLLEQQLAPFSDDPAHKDMIDWTKQKFDDYGNIYLEQNGKKIDMNGNELPDVGDTWFDEESGQTLRYKGGLVDDPNSWEVVQ